MPTARLAACSAVPTAMSCPRLPGARRPGPPPWPPTPAPSGDVPQGVTGWTTDNAFNLPAARTGAAGWAANGGLYIVGGSDGTSSKPELYWALPDAAGNLSGWKHLAETDLPQGVENAALVVSGATVFLIGGDAGSGAIATSTKASLAPQEPFFRLGLVGLTVPGLQIGGEIGQQLGYLAAAGVGTGNFVILVAIGWAFNHREMLRGWWDRRKARKEAQAPREA